MTIGVGQEAVSDPVGFAATTETDLALSTHHASETGPATYYPFALQTGYVARGDVVPHPKLPEFEEADPRSYLSVTDVWTPKGRRVVAFGDSLTDGVGTTPNANLRYAICWLARSPRHTGLRRRRARPWAGVGRRRRHRCLRKVRRLLLRLCVVRCCALDHQVSREVTGTGGEILWCHCMTICVPMVGADLSVKVCRVRRGGCVRTAAR